MGSTENHLRHPHCDENVFCVLFKTNAIAAGYCMLEMQPINRSQTALEAANIAPTYGENIPVDIPMGITETKFKCKSRCRSLQQRERLRALNRRFSTVQDIRRVSGYLLHALQRRRIRITSKWGFRRNSCFSRQIQCQKLQC
jgi:hypothetical protein